MAPPLGRIVYSTESATLGQLQTFQDEVLLLPGQGAPEVRQTGWHNLPFCAAYCLRDLGQLLNYMGLGFLTCKMGYQLSGTAKAEKQRTTIGELNCICEVLG